MPSGYIHVQTHTQTRTHTKATLAYQDMYSHTSMALIPGLWLV